MEHTTDQKNWEPIEGLPKQRRKGPGTKLSKKRADHRNANIVAVPKTQKDAVNYYI